MTTQTKTPRETTPEAIRLVMTWQAAAPIFCLVLTDGNQSGHQSARAEILRMASQADRVRDMAEAVAEAKAEARTARGNAGALAAELAEMRETLAGVLDSFDTAQGATLRGQIYAARAKLRTIGTGAPEAPEMVRARASLAACNAALQSARVSDSCKAELARAAEYESAFIELNKATPEAD